MEGRNGNVEEHIKGGQARTPLAGENVEALARTSEREKITLGDKTPRACGMAVNRWVQSGLATDKRRGKRMVSG